MRITEEKPVPIEEEIVRGLMYWTCQTFNMQDGINLFYAATTTKAVQAAQQRAQRDGRALEWPIMYMKLSEATRNVGNTAYNPRSLARHGVYVTTDTKDREYARKLHPMRVDMTFEYNFLVDDTRRALSFISSWMTLGQEQKLNFTINYYGVGMDIACRLADSVSVPEKETSVDEAVNVYEFTTSILCEGYVTAQHVDNDSDIALVRTINVAAQPVDDLAELSKPGVLNKALAHRSR